MEIFLFLLLFSLFFECQKSIHHRLVDCLLLLSSYTPVEEGNHSLRGNPVIWLKLFEQKTNPLLAGISFSFFYLLT
uniref:Uncharacterized protein n=1 Tax=Daphnia magna TaxID=35525 RepID=A0A0P5CAE3_9CRUS